MYVEFHLVGTSWTTDKGCVLLSICNCFSRRCSAVLVECLEWPTNLRALASSFSTLLVLSIACLMTVYKRWAIHTWLAMPLSSASNLLQATMFAASSWATQLISLLPRPKDSTTDSWWSERLTAVWLPWNCVVFQTKTYKRPVFINKMASVDDKALGSQLRPAICGQRHTTSSTAFQPCLHYTNALLVPFFQHHRRMSSRWDRKSRVSEYCI